MKRKTRFLIGVLPRLVLFAVDVAATIIMALEDGWEVSALFASMGYWVLDSYFAELKNYRLREAAINLFNIIHPTEELGDEDWVDFKVVEKDGKVTVRVDVTRVAEKKFKADGKK